jgi:antitoxin (DNA-binding transcriptional repressor) of toxin-antitoxin stability system
MKGIQIPVRELHARTGHYVRKAVRQRIIITDRGKPVAELHPFGSASAGAAGSGWSDRLADPAFTGIVNEPAEGTDSSIMVAEERDR